MAEETLYEKGKKSLKTLLREKAYADVKEHLEKMGINMSDVSDEDIENLVASKVQDMTNNIQGFVAGTAFSVAISLFMEV